MKKVLLVLVSLAALATIAGVLTGIFFPESLSASNRRIKGSGTIVTRTIPAPDFEKISASRAVKVIITDEIEDRIRIEADDNLMDYIVAEASGDELRISIDPKINSVSNIHVTVTVPDNGKIRALEASSASEITCATALGAAKISLEASSARQHQRSRQGRRLLARSHKCRQDQGRCRGRRMPDQRLKRRQDQSERPGRHRTSRTQLGVKTCSGRVGRQTMEDRHLERRKRPDPLHRTTRRRGIERLLDPL